MSPTGRIHRDKPLGGTKTEDRALRRRNSSAEFGAGIAAEIGLISAGLHPGTKRKISGVWGADSHLKAVLSEALLGGQLQVDPVIGMADPFGRFVVKGFDLLKQRRQSRSLVPDLPRCTAIQRAVYPKLVVMRLPIIQPLRQILGR